MNFYKTFKEDYINCGKVNLPWDQVRRDLESVKDDKSRLRAITEGTVYNDGLNNIQNEYLGYGYNDNNTRIWKTTNIEPKLTFDWEQQIIDQLPLDHAIATVTRQDPGQILPWHKDRFFMLRRLYPEDPRPIWRFLLMMEDWKMGHILQINNSIFTHWKQGDVVVWQPDTMHVSANIGLDTKWTCNITGFLTV